jgi:hypothetical protein
MKTWLSKELAPFCGDIPDATKFGLSHYLLIPDYAMENSIQTVPSGWTDENQ